MVCKELSAPAALSGPAVDDCRGSEWTATAGGGRLDYAAAPAADWPAHEAAAAKAARNAGISPGDAAGTHGRLPIGGSGASYGPAAQEGAADAPEGGTRDCTVACAVGGHDVFVGACPPGRLRVLHSRRDAYARDGLGAPEWVFPVGAGACASAGSADWRWGDCLAGGRGLECAAEWLSLRPGVWSAAAAAAAAAGACGGCAGG